MKDAWDGYYAAKRTPVNEDGREEAEEKGYAVNHFSPVVVTDATGQKFAFPDASYDIGDGFLEVATDRGIVATFAHWISVIRPTDHSEVVEIMSANTEPLVGNDGSQRRPPRPGPRMRANMAPQ